MTVLSPELRQVVQRAGEQPVRLEDPETHEAYVLIKQEVFDQMKALVEEEIEGTLSEFDDFEPLNEAS